MDGAGHRQMQCHKSASVTLGIEQNMSAGDQEDQANDMLLQNSLVVSHTVDSDCQLLLQNGWTP